VKVKSAILLTKIGEIGDQNRRFYFSNSAILLEECLPFFFRGVAFDFLKA